MREESHLDAMRDAIRGDFERLAERRGEQDLLQVTEQEAAFGEEPDHESNPELESDAETEPIELERTSWLARLFSP